MYVCLLQPQSRGSVRLAGNHPAQPPLIDPNYFSHPADMRDLLRGFRLMRNILSQPALAQLGGKELAASAAAQSEQEIEQFIRNHADSVYHPAGTCRMGPNAQDVVDEQLRVHGIAGLRVVDASIMPQLVSGNTNAVVIMIAEKAAEMIKQAERW